MSNIQKLKREALANRVCGFSGDLTLDRALKGNVDINNICAALRNTHLERADLVALLSAMAGSVATKWPRTARGMTTPEAMDVLEWLDYGGDAIADGVGLSDWVRK